MHVFQSAVAVTTFRRENEVTKRPLSQEAALILMLTRALSSHEQEVSLGLISEHCPDSDQ